MVQYGEKNRFMNKILVGIDGSEGSGHALNKAMTLISEYGELILLAVVPSPSDKTFVDDEISKKLRKKADHMIKDLIEDIGVHDFTVTGSVEVGDAAAKIENRICCNCGGDLYHLDHNPGLATAASALRPWWGIRLSVAAGPILRPSNY